jgi:hypothetical protein
MEYLNYFLHIYSNSMSFLKNLNIYDLNFYDYDYQFDFDLNFDFDFDSHFIDHFLNYFCHNNLSYNY